MDTISKMVDEVAIIKAKKGFNEKRAQIERERIEKTKPAWNEYNEKMEQVWKEYKAAVIAAGGTSEDL